jgi:hypothetical protein
MFSKINFQKDSKCLFLPPIWPPHHSGITFLYLSTIFFISIITPLILLVTPSYRIFNLKITSEIHISSIISMPANSQGSCQSSSQISRTFHSIYITSMHYLYL